MYFFKVFVSVAYFSPTFGSSIFSGTAGSFFNISSSISNFPAWVYAASFPNLSPAFSAMASGFEGSPSGLVSFISVSGSLWLDPCPGKCLAFF